MGECGLYLGKRRIGMVRWEEKDGIMRLEASCPIEEGMIYRVFLKREDALIPLGVMLPERDRFLLHKEIPAGKVPQLAAIDRARPGEAHLPGLPLALSAFSEMDAEEAKALQADTDCDLPLCAFWLGESYLLYPFRPGKACAMAPYFCLTRLIRTEQGIYGVFCQKEGSFCALPEEKSPEETGFAAARW